MALFLYESSLEKVDSQSFQRIASLKCLSLRCQPPLLKNQHRTKALFRHIEKKKKNRYHLEYKQVGGANDS